MRLVVVGLAGAALLAQNTADLSGRWEMDPEQSQHQPADETIVERIQHTGQKVVITTVSNRPGRDERRHTVRLTTDGAENLNIVLGREMTAKTVWEDGKLVTHVRDQQGMQFFEVRTLSEDGKQQVVEGFMDPSRRRRMFRRVMVKLDP